MSYFEFPHTRTYDGDLGYIIKKLEDLTNKYNTFFMYNQISFADPIEWDITKQYKAYTIVFYSDDMVSLISKQPVPTGIDIHNSDYWEFVGPLTVDGEARNRIDRILRFITNIYEADVTASAPRAVGDFLVITGELYQVTAPINTGETYTNGVNVTKTTIEDMAIYLINELRPIDAALDNTSTNAISNKAVADKFTLVDAAINLINDTFTTIHNEIANMHTEIGTVESNVNAALSQVDNNINNLNAAIAAETAARQSEDNTINGRIDSLATLSEGSTTGDAELIDGRTGANGYVWSSIGNAIRGQADQTNKIINNLNFNTGSTLEQGNIGVDGSLISSNKNFRLVNFMNPAVYKVTCSNYYTFAIVTYNPDGSFVSRSAFGYTSYNTFDHVNYKYKVTFKRVDDADCTPDTDGTHFYSVVGDVAELTSLYNNDMSIPVVWEQGNISGYDGSNVASANNIRTKFYIPENVKSVMAKPGYILAVSRRLKADGTFVDRSAYTIEYYDSFDFSVYTYRICAAKVSNIEALGPSDGSNVIFNTATLDQIQLNKKDIKSLEPCKIPQLLPRMDNAYMVIARALFGLKTFSKFDTTGFDITDATYKSHDATPVILNNKVYVIRSVYLTYDNAQSNDCKVVLTSANLDGSGLINIDIAKNGDVIGGYTMQAGCGSPNMYKIGDVLHIYFTGKSGDTYLVFHCTYDTSISTLGGFSPIMVNGSVCNTLNSWIIFQHPYNPQNGFHGMQMNASITSDGTYFYAGLTEGTADPEGRGVILKSSDMVNWSIFARLDPNIIRPVYEVACLAKSGYLYIMTRSDYTSYNGLLAKYNTSTGALVDSCYVQNGCTRPDLIEFSGYILLVNTEDRQRRSVSITLIDETSLINSQMQYQAYYTGDVIQYLRLCSDGVNIYGAATYNNGGLLAIHVGEIDLNVISYSDVTNALNNLV